MIEEDLFAFVTSATTAPLTQPIVGTRFDAGFLQEGSKLPALSYSVISATHESTFDGRGGLCRLRVQIDCWAQSYLGAKTLKEAVRQDLDGFSGTMGATAVQLVQLISETDLYEPDSRIYRTSMDFFIWYPES